MSAQQIEDRFIRIGEVINKTGRARSTIYADIQKLEFPAPIKTGLRASAWLLSDIDAWMTRRIEESRQSHKGAA